jgi:hypothetical protein
MQFQLVYTNAGYHARLFNGKGELIFWTREYEYKQELIDVCSELKMAVGDAPILDTEAQ